MSITFSLPCDEVLGSSVWILIGGLKPIAMPFAGGMLSELVYRLLITSVIFIYLRSRNLKPAGNSLPAMGK